MSTSTIPSTRLESRSRNFFEVCSTSDDFLIDLPSRSSHPTGCSRSIVRLCVQSLRSKLRTASDVCRRVGGTRGERRRSWRDSDFDSVSQKGLGPRFALASTPTSLSVVRLGCLPDSDSLEGAVDDLDEAVEVLTSNRFEVSASFDAIEIEPSACVTSHVVMSARQHHHVIPDTHLSACARRRRFASRLSVTRLDRVLMFNHTRSSRVI